MKKQSLLAAVFALPFAAGVATADETSFHALSGVSAAPMSNEQLATVEGGFFDTCIACTQTNGAVVTQVNASILSALLAQTNASAVGQSNNIN